MNKNKILLNINEKKCVFLERLFDVQQTFRY